jgi:hypothetical protein
MMVWWRFKHDVPGPWRFGFQTDIGSGLVRMGDYNGDTHGGLVVDLKEIEMRSYVRQY